jgi:cytochrome c oxidase subunit II
MSSSRRSRPSQTAIFALAVGALIIGLSLVLLFYGVNVLEEGQEFLTGLYPPIAVTTQGAEIRNLYTAIFLIAVAIFLVVEGLIIWSVIRYRRKPTDVALPPQTHGNNVAEFVWTIVPTILVIFMFIVSWQTLNSVDVNSPTAQTRIRAVAGQFQWTFEYLDASDNVVYTEFQPLAEKGGGMYVPAGRTVQLNLFVSPKDVIHAFYVPQFLFKRDVVPGRTTAFDFTVNEADAGQTFRGQCAELCGSGHRIMLFDVHALAPADFDAWLKDKVANAPPPAPSGAAPSGAVPSGPVASGPAPSGPAPSGPPPSAGGAGPTLAIAAQNVAYDVNALQAPANTPFHIAFDNKDNAVPHNVAIHQGSPTGTEVFKGEIFPGPATKTYDVPALPAGTYAFVCSVHPNMTGTLTVN